MADIAAQREKWRQKMQQYFAVRAPQKTPQDIEHALVHYNQPNNGGWPQMYQDALERFGPDPAVSGQTVFTTYQQQQQQQHKVVHTALPQQPSPVVAALAPADQQVVQQIVNQQNDFFRIDPGVEIVHTSSAQQRHRSQTPPRRDMLLSPAYSQPVQEQVVQQVVEVTPAYSRPVQEQVVQQVVQVTHAPALAPLPPPQFIVNPPAIMAPVVLTPRESPREKEIVYVTEVVPAPPEVIVVNERGERVDMSQEQVTELVNQKPPTSSPIAIPIPAAAAVHGPSYRERLVQLYELYDPAKLGAVDALLESFAGNEEENIHRLQQKYEAGAYRVKQYDPTKNETELIQTPMPGTSVLVDHGLYSPHTEKQKTKIVYVNENDEKVRTLEADLSLFRDENNMLTLQSRQHAGLQLEYRTKNNALETANAELTREIQRLRESGIKTVVVEDEELKKKHRELELRLMAKTNTLEKTRHTHGKYADRTYDDLLAELEASREDNRRLEELITELEGKNYLLESKARDWESQLKIRRSDHTEKLNEMDGRWQEREAELEMKLLVAKKSNSTLERQMDDQTDKHKQKLEKVAVQLKQAANDIDALTDERNELRTELKTVTYSTLKQGKQTDFHPESHTITAALS